jgi:hypothetical protein
MSSIAAHPSRTRAQGRRRAALLCCLAAVTTIALFALVGAFVSTPERSFYVTGVLTLVGTQMRRAGGPYF